MLVWTRFGFVFMEFLRKKWFEYRSGTLVGIQKKIFAAKKIEKKNHLEYRPMFQIGIPFSFFYQNTLKRKPNRLKKSIARFSDFFYIVLWWFLGRLSYEIWRKVGSKIWNFDIFDNFFELSFDFSCLSAD